MEEYGLAGREVVRGFVVISYSLTTPSAFAVATARHPSTGGEPDCDGTDGIPRQARYDDSKKERKMKRISILAGLVVIATGAYGANPETKDIATSQYYVDEQLSNRQDMVPAKTGDKAVTPTGTRGTIGEREIKTDLGNETTNQSDTGLTTIETVNTALGNKQVTLYKQPTVNVLTYTGTNIDPNGYTGVGVATSTPIYDETTNTYGNGLVRAGTLNTAVANAVNDALTQVDETGNASNSGALWRINDLNTVLPITMYAVASDTPTSYCYKRVQTDSTYTDARGSCSTTLYDDFARGDWGVVMPRETGITYNGTCTGNSCDKEIRGISACTDQTFSGYAYGVMAPDGLTATLQTAYENGKSGATPSGRYCYCRATEPHIGTTTVASPWVFNSSSSSASDCALRCANRCADHVRYFARFRGAVFGGVNVTP